LKRSISLFVDDIIDSMHRIQTYIHTLNYDDFIENQMIIDAVIRNIEIIGEAANNIPNEIRNDFSDIPWKRMVGLRNIVSHGYFGIDLEIIWEIITKNLPQTKPLIVEMKKKIN
jgi:uncharacterized protein with HEPN domain